MNKDKKIRKLAKKVDALHLIHANLIVGNLYHGDESELKKRVMKQLQAEAAKALVEIDNILMSDD